MISVFRKIINCTFGFRECSQLVKIAKNNNCEIKFIRNDKEGSTKSIISLVSLGLLKNDSIVIQIIDGDQPKAFHQINHLIEKGWNADDNN